MESPQPLIAVVEDDENIAEMLDLVLTMRGTTVVRVPPSEQVVTDLQAIRPTLVILDMWLGSIDGVTILRQMRAVDGLARVPVIFFTATEAVVRHQLPALAELGVQLVAKPGIAQLITCVRGMVPGLLH